MEVRVHLPQDISSLYQALAAAHAEMVLRYIERLQCPQEQKTEIAQMVIEKTNSQA